MIESIGLTKRFGGRAVVQDVTFACEPGTVTGFLGPNGAGKTTTLRMLCGLSEPDAGDAAVLGGRYSALPNPGRRVGILLDASAQHPGRRGRETLALSARLMGVPEKRADELLGLVGLDRSAARKRVRQYSLGMRQRLGLAHAMLGDPEVLILDEPANGLDPQGIRWLRDFLRSMAVEGRTVLVSSHVLAEVAQTVDDVVVIHRGRLVDQGPVSRLTAGGHVVARSPRASELQAALERAGLGVTADADVLVIDADDPARVGDLAFEAGIVLHELTTRATSLEEAFLELTRDEEAAP
jgi:ABC-2 type transport system ATP-binding protein